MDTVHSLVHGFSVALQLNNLLFCFFGVLIGTLVGVLPGIGPVGAISILLPISFRMSPVSAIILLAGIFYGSAYGGSTTSILVGIPGESFSIITVLEGYQMARQGRAGPALGIAAFGSFFAGTLGVVGLMLFASPLSEFALNFGPPEYFGLFLLGLTLVIYLSFGSVIKGIMMGAFGLTLGCIGLDPMQGSQRMTFNMMQLWDGVNLVPVAMGMFGIAEILVNMETISSFEILKTKIKNFFPTLFDWMRSKGAILRGTVIGFFIGLLPGGNAVIASFLSYTIEKKISKEPDRFGKGAIEGVAGPESANNAATAGGLVPLFTLGLPTSVVMALLFGALLIHGIRPGPFLLKDNPDLFWGVISSMYLGNLMLLVLNLPLIPIWVQVLKVPARILYPLILLFCIVGCYGVNDSVFDLVIMMIFGLIGYLFKKFQYEAAPLLLAFVLGPMVEKSLRLSLTLSGGSPLIFFTRPISAVLVSIAIILFVTSFLSNLVKMKRRPQGAC